MAYLLCSDWEGTAGIVLVKLNKEHCDGNWCGWLQINSSCKIYLGNFNFWLFLLPEYANCIYILLHIVAYSVLQNNKNWIMLIYLKCVWEIQLYLAKQYMYNILFKSSCSVRFYKFCNVWHSDLQMQISILFLMKRMRDWSKSQFS